MKALAVIVLSVWVGLAATLTAHAQSITTIYSFTNSPANPKAPLTVGPDGNFYGTTASGGINNNGTVFKLSTNGTWITLVNFNGTNGTGPWADLTLGPDGNFYGTTYGGGSSGGYGTVFKMTTDGTLTTLFSFNFADGCNPEAGLTLGADGNFYGTTYGGGTGTGNGGTVFQVTTNGTLTTLVNFNNANGAYPSADLTLGPDGNLYGTCCSGGLYGDGTVFKVTTNGTLTTLANFGSANFSHQQAGLALGPDGNFYGTTEYGGSANAGTVFQVTTNGTLTTLVSFNITNNGGYPSAGLTLGSDGNIYGTTTYGGSGGQGTMFKVTTNGTLTTFANYTTTAPSPTGNLTLGPDGNFYGTTARGGISNIGTVFQLTTNGTLTTLVNFDDSTGDNPQAGLTLGPDGNLYGTTVFGGSGDEGTVFQVTTKGALTTLANFKGTNGANPMAGLMLGSDGSFYGTTYSGAANGTVFKVTTNGTLTMLARFISNPTNGANPYAGLIQGPDGNFYGTTYSSQGVGTGTVFKVTTNGKLTTLVSFNGTNGANPTAGLTLGPDGNLYGTTSSGGNTYPGGNDGTAFKVTTNGTFTTLVKFVNYTNGAQPYAGLTLGPDGNFYGTTFAGGNGNSGIVFKMTTNGTLTKLVSFKGTNGANPYAGLTLGPDGNFYGTTQFGGLTNLNSGKGYGTAFKVTASGILTTLISFNNTNGSYPYAGLALGPDGNFYGTTVNGGNGGGGTIFQLELPPDFITAPTNQTAVIGGNVTFNSQVFGTGPFAYQWLFNGVPIDGAANATLSLNQALANQAGSYQLVVSNAFGSVTSQPVSLNVLVQPNIYGISKIGGGNFTVSLASLPNSTNRLWATTNMALPFAEWQVIATNVTDGNGLSQFLDTNIAGMPQKFYRLSWP